MVSRLALSVLGIISMAVVSIAQTEGNGPVIIPERLQEIAKKYPITERLGIRWDKATTGDTGKYLGFLAAASELSASIARKDERKAPIDADYMAAFQFSAF